MNGQFCCRLLGIALLLYLLAACSAGQPAPQVKQQQALNPPQTQRSSVRQVQRKETVISAARKMLGSPYRYGGSSPSGFDCSGLVRYAYGQVGVRLPRTSHEMFLQSTKVSVQNLRPGDLLFFRLSPPKISHVAIYDRDGRFIHAPSSGQRVSYASLDNPYWRKHLVAAGRF